MISGNSETSGISITPMLPRWALMWALAVAIFFALKWLTWRRTPHATVRVWKQITYVIAWPGMDAAAFFSPAKTPVLRYSEGPGPAPQSPALRSTSGPAVPRFSEWLFALSKTIVGIVMLFFAARRLPFADPYWTGWIGMIGIAMCLHFGLFHLISCAWRTAGIDARPLMNWPLLATRLSDYWGRRWNTAFRDVTHKFLFKPLTRRLGGRGALWIGFLASGLIHDAVISIPAGGGYGGPTLFFLFQALGISLERSRTGRRLRLGRGFRGWLFTMAFLILPAPLLFHRPFVARIIVPFMHAIGAL